jgi:hypothetical protein
LKSLGISSEETLNFAWAKCLWPRIFEFKLLIFLFRHTYSK